MKTINDTTTVAVSLQTRGVGGMERDKDGLCTDLFYLFNFNFSIILGCGNKNIHCHQQQNRPKHVIIACQENNKVNLFMSTQEQHQQYNKHNADTLGYLKTINAVFKNNYKNI